MSEDRGGPAAALPGGGNDCGEAPRSGEPRGPAEVVGSREAAPGDWPRLLALHLAPAAITFAAALLLAPWIHRLGVPPDFALTVAFAIFLTPIEFGLLLLAAARVTGRTSVRVLPAVLTYRRPLRRWALLIPVLFGVAVLLAAAYTPVSDGLGDALTGVLPGWLLPRYDVSTLGYAVPVLVVTQLVTLLVDGVVNPVVEELYFRAYLLPRLPLAGWARVVASAGLFAVQHYWQPYNWLLIFVLQLILTALIVRSGSIRLGIAMHVLANCFGILLTLVAILS